MCFFTCFFRLALAFQTEATDYTFINLHTLDFLSMFRGESERNVELIFQVAEAKQPAIIYLSKNQFTCKFQTVK